MTTPNEQYWLQMMANRMPPRDEVVRLTTALYGFFARQTELADIRDFCDSKRPYGNKDIAASIAFNLGWDKDRVLCQDSMPDFVKDEAWKLHDAVAAGLEPTPRKRIQPA